ncbi:unnamed protein product [Meloidogyne enterolobii]|uniref:Uncharacterized protein n=1 Tax=Meloidogyne enterolobii TaxID=390850 RepID=A0ACB1ABJ2_MELEN
MFSLKDFFLYFSICLSIPSVIVYILEVWTIICNKTLHNSFYTLFSVRAIFVNFIFCFYNQISNSLKVFYFSEIL